MKQWLDFWEKCKGKKGSPVLIGLLVGLLLLVITWPDNSSKKQNTQTKTNAPAVENNVRNTEDLAQERTQRMEQRLEEVLREVDGVFLWYFEKDSIICTCIFWGGKIMLKLIVFETEEELCELTGLTEHELWQKGFNLDDWEIGFQSEVKLHKTPTKKDIENGYRENELIALFDLPAHWLMSQMNAYCVGANYVFLDGKHYYTVHHA